MIGSLGKVTPRKWTCPPQQKGPFLKGDHILQPLIFSKCISFQSCKQMKCKEILTLFNDPNIHEKWWEYRMFFQQKNAVKLDEIQKLKPDSATRPSQMWCWFPVCFYFRDLYTTRNTQNHGPWKRWTPLKYGHFWYLCQSSEGVS